MKFRIVSQFRTFRKLLNLQKAFKIPSKIIQKNCRYLHTENIEKLMHDFDKSVGNNVLEQISKRHGSNETSLAKVQRGGGERWR